MRSGRDWDEGATLMVFGAVIGLVTGLTVVGFYRMIDLANLIFIRLPESRLLSFAHALYQPVEQFADMLLLVALSQFAVVAYLLQN